MSKIIFTNSINSNIRYIMFYLYIIINFSLLKFSQPNIINIYNINEFIDFNGLEICGDKYLAKTKSGEVYISTDLGYNWRALEGLTNVRKIVSFENSDLNKFREKYKNGNKFSNEFLKSMFMKKIKKEKFENYMKLNIPEENTAFITFEGKIIFSRDCGLDMFQSIKDKKIYNFNEKLLVRDFIFHPYEQEKGFIIAFDQEEKIYGFNNNIKDLRFIEIYLTENFGKTFRKIQSFNHEELKKYTDFKW